MSCSELTMIGLRYLVTYWLSHAFVCFVSQVIFFFFFKFDQANAVGEHFSEKLQYNSENSGDGVLSLRRFGPRI